MFKAVAIGMEEVEVTYQGGDGDQGELVCLRASMEPAAAVVFAAEVTRAAHQAAKTHWDRHRKERDAILEGCSGCDTARRLGVATQGQG